MGAYLPFTLMQYEDNFIDLGSLAPEGLELTRSCFIFKLKEPRWCMYLPPKYFSKILLPKNWKCCTEWLSNFEIEGPVGHGTWKFNTWIVGLTRSVWKNVHFFGFVNSSPLISEVDRRPFELVVVKISVSHLVSCRWVVTSQILKLDNHFIRDLCKPFDLK